MFLWVSIAVVTLVATGLVVWPLVSARVPAAADDRDDERRRLAVFRDRRREIDREREAGRLSADEAEQAQADLLRQLAADLPESAPAHPAGTRHAARARPWLVAGFVAVLVPLVAVGIYRQVGAPQFAAGDAGPAATMPDAAQIERMVAQVEQRTRENPDDGEAWAMLAEARKIQGRHAEAVRAFEQATQKLPADARLLTDYAESEALLAGGDFSGRPVELLERALKADPSEPKAIALMGAAQYRLGNLERARIYLAKLEELLPAGSDEKQQIADVRKRIDDELAQRPGPGANAGVPAKAPPASSPPPSSPPPSSPPASASPAALHGLVTVDPALIARVGTGATLYVIARESGGPRAPIAVLRVPSPSFPVPFTLDDANAMNPARRLASAASLEIEARLSRSGDAARHPGDLFGQLADVRPGQSDLKIVIDAVVQP